MSEQIVLHAKSREAQGKGASRRLRREGLVPAIIYGAGKEPKMISLEHSKLLRYEMDESFFSSILKVDIDGGTEENVLIRDYQAQVIWIGRRKLSHHIQAKIDKLSSLGPAPVYISADATDLTQMHAALQECKETFGTIHGLVYTALVLQDASIRNMTEERFANGLSSKAAQWQPTTAMLFPKKTRQKQKTSCSHAVLAPV